MKNSFLLLLLLLFSCFQNQDDIQLLQSSKVIALNDSFKNEMFYNNCGAYHWFKYVNDSTTFHIYYRNPIKDGMPVTNSTELDSEFWDIDGIIHPTKKELIRILKDYHVDINKFNITQIDSLRYNFRNIKTNDEFKVSFSLAKLEYYELSKEQKKDYFIDSKKTVYGCKDAKRDGKYTLSIFYFNEEREN